MARHTNGLARPHALSPRAAAAATPVAVAAPAVPSVPIRVVVRRMRILAALDRINRKLADVDSVASMLVRIQLDRWVRGPLNRARSACDFIRQMAEIGCTAAEIARFSGAPLSSVAPIMSREKAKRRAQAASRTPTREGTR